MPRQLSRSGDADASTSVLPKTNNNSNAGVALSPLDVEGPLKPGGGGDDGGGAGAGVPSLDEKIDKHLLPCLCAISVANYLGEKDKRAVVP